MARMEMDCNLKKLANFSKFILCIIQKSLKTWSWFVLPCWNQLIFSSWHSNSNFILEKKSWAVLIKIQQNDRDSDPLIRNSFENTKCYMYLVSCGHSQRYAVKRLSWLFESWILLWSRPRKIDARSFEVITFIAKKVITNKPREIKLTNPIQSSFIVIMRSLSHEAIIEPWSGGGLGNV